MLRGMPYGGPDYSVRESISAAGGQPLEGVAAVALGAVVVG
jgi:hypothetical protein